MKRKSQAPKFVVKRSTFVNEFMKVHAANHSVRVDWTGDMNAANVYPSRYAAKVHLDLLSHIAEIPALREIVAV